MYHLVWCLCAGNLRTQDRDGPYNLTLLPVQVNEVRGVLPPSADFASPKLSMLSPQIKICDCGLSGKGSC